MNKSDEGVHVLVPLVLRLPVITILVARCRLILLLRSAATRSAAIVLLGFVLLLSLFLRF